MDLIFYRFEFDGMGIYEAVDQFCPRDDPRREYKPGGGWLAKVGPDFPTAISYWTMAGLARYQKSGLLAWHLSVLPEKTTVRCASLVGEPLYQDEHQIIVDPELVETIEVRDAAYFL